MKTLKQFIFISILLLNINIVTISQVIFSENFETSGTQNQWENEYVSGSDDWEFRAGGHDGFPEFAKNGSYNAYFQSFNTESRITKLVSPSIDLATIQKYRVELRFWHAMDDFIENTDMLYIYIKTHEDSSWINLKTYTEPEETWVERIILLDDSLYTDDVYIAFEGRTNRGHGICIDSVVLIETGILDRYLDTIVVSNASTEFVSTGITNNPILRIQLVVQGNTNDLIFDSLAVKSLNTDDADIAENGIKLFYTTNDVFSTDNQVSDNANFNNGTAVFNNINQVLPTGYSYLWVTYDIDTNANEGNYVDAQISANSIKIDSSLYPQSNLSPYGKRKILRTIFYDDFENNKGWYFKGEFERAIPLGKSGLSGNSDPENAFEGDYVIGSDLTDNGYYEANLADTAYLAITPPVDAYYYKNVLLSFQRWLNVEILDKAKMGYIAGGSFTNIWQNNNYIIDYSWKNQKFDLSSYNLRDENLKIYFSIGPTTSLNNYTGWNIDNFLITGDYISKDVGITKWISPVDGCGHSATEPITVEITNFGGEDSPAEIPLYFSFTAGNTKVYDTIYQSIPKDSSIEYTFNPTYDLTNGGFFNVKAGTLLGADQDITNNSFDTNLVIIPTKTIPYSENYEGNESFWISYGSPCSWNLNTASAPIINTASSGYYIWVTDNTEYYLNNENSYVESPCFDFTGTENPLYEMKIIYELEDSADGVFMLYSIDCGTTWDTLGEFNEPYDSLWNWYNSDSIGETGFNGWTGNTDSLWITTKKLLPSEIAGQPCVRFRIGLNTDAANVYEGFAFDDVKIYEAPPDVGVIEIVNPVSACELNDNEYVKVGIKNMGIKDLSTGQTCIVALDINGTQEAIDTFIFNKDVPVNDTIQYIFNAPININHAGTYALKAYTKLQGDVNIYDTINNDTSALEVEVYGMPDYTLGLDIGTNQPDTIILNAGAGYTNYLWNDNSILQTYAVPAGGYGKYSVTVTNDSGCTASDTIEVIQSDADLGITAVNNLTSDCELSNTFFPEVVIKNFGPDSLFIDDTTLIGYSVNSIAYIDTLVLTDTLCKDSSINYTYKLSIDLSIKGEYSFDLYTLYSGDIKRSNDSISENIEVYGYPNVDLGEDTVFTAQADTIILDAGEGYATYEWQDASTEDTLKIQELTSNQYKVTVTDVHGCGSDSDSIQIISYDLKLGKIIQPLSNCELTSTEHITVQIINNGYDTLPVNHPVELELNVDENIIDTTFLLLSKLEPSDSVNLTFSRAFDFSKPGSYSVSVSNLWNLDINSSNNILDEEIIVYGYPVFNLGDDTILTNAPASIELTTISGYDNYLWQDGSTDENYQITEETSQLYSVTVSDNHGCSYSDSVHIINYDIGIIAISNPISGCFLSTMEPLIITFTNNCNDTLFTGDNITIGVIFNNTDTFIESIELNADVYPGGQNQLVLSKYYNLSEIGNYNFKVYSISNLDIMPNNDTLTLSIKNAEYPDVDFGIDTIFTTQPDTLIIDAGSGFKTYRWHDGSFSQNYTVTNLLNQTFTVTVTDHYGCGQDSDTLTVISQNIGVSDITYPINSCSLTDEEKISISIKNYGKDIIFSGMSIPVIYSGEDNIPLSENYILQTNLKPDSLIYITSSNTLDFSSTGNHEIKVWAGLHADADKNDTLTKQFIVYGHPEIDLGNDIFTNEPDTVILNPGAAHSYLWEDGSTNSTYSVSKLYSKTYFVTVANEYGCETIDSILINTSDLLLSSINEPNNSCMLNEDELVSATIINNCYDTIKAGNKILFTYIAKGNTKYDTLVLDEPLLPNDSIIHISEISYNMSQADTYSIYVQIDYENDVKNENNFFTKDVVVYGPPPLNLGPDIIKTGEADTIILKSNEEFADYKWQDGSTANQYAITNKEPFVYFLTVTDIYGCIASDSVTIISYDLELSEIDLPENACELSNETVIPFKIKNNGSLTIESNEKINLLFTLNNVEYDTSLVLSESLATSENTDLNFPLVFDFSNKNINNYSLEAKINYDYNSLNNIISDELEIFGYPEVKFKGETNNKITVEIPYQLELTESYNSYKWHDGKSSPKYSIHKTGEYSVTVTDNNECTGEGSIEVTVKDANNIIKSNSNAEINIYPNPADDKLYILINNYNDLIYIKLINSNGKNIINSSYSGFELIEGLDISDLEDGIYVLMLNSKNVTKKYKIIIQ